MMFAKLRNWWKAASAAEPSTGTHPTLHSPGRFHDLLHRERSRADRSGQPFALVVFRVETGRPGESVRLARRIAERLRGVDHAGWLDHGSIGVILTSTQDAGARTFAASILRWDSQEIACDYEVYVYPGCASTDSRHGRDRRPAEAAEPRETVREAEPATSLAVEQRLAATVEMMRELCDDRETASRSLESLLVRPLPRWKRAIDVVGATVALVLFAPVMLIAAVLVKATSRGPVIFRQQRVGLGGRLFTIYKLRTMYVGAEGCKAELRRFSEQDGPAFKMANDPRITPVGRYLRKACIDEMPQLWNVLVGDMTLVGPRPLDVPETAQIAGWQRRRVEVTPGLTCIWQIHGKSRVPFAEWMRMDIRYLQARTLLRDLKLIARTVLAVLLHRGSG